MESDTLSILDRIRVVEDKIEKGMVAAPAGYGAQGQMGANGLPMGGNMSGGTVGGADGPAAGAGTQKPAELPKAIPEDIREVVQNFRAIVTGVQTAPENLPGESETEPGRRQPVAAGIFRCNGR